MPCPICGSEGVHHPTYPNIVCEECDNRAVNKDGEKPWYGSPSDSETDSDSNNIKLPPDQGENPVFIDGHKCWRRYRFGGWITMMDEHDCQSLEEFYEKHNIDAFGSESDQK